jgi:hypothetical protein
VAVVSGPVAVQLRTGPVHLAFAVSDARLVAVCGAHFGSASAVPGAAWTAEDARVCADCDDAAARARSVRQLRAFAGV